MRLAPYLLRFEDRREASSIFAPFGIDLEGPDWEGSYACACGVIAELAFDNGILRRPNGETVEFEGEPIQLTTALPGFYIYAACSGGLPAALQVYAVKRDPSKVFPVRYQNGTPIEANSAQIAAGGSRVC